MKYYLIHNSDGDTSVIEYWGKQRLLDEIQSGQWGESPEFLSDIPTNSDTGTWQGKMLIIKGEIVTLQKKEVVTKYDLP